MPGCPKVRLLLLGRIVSRRPATFPTLFPSMQTPHVPKAAGCER